MKRVAKIVLVITLMLGLAYAKENKKLSFTDTNGKVYNVTGTDNGLLIDRAKNKIVFLELFGHKCPSCIKSIPHYKRIQAKYAKNVQVIAIEVQGYSDSQVRSFSKERGINYVTVSQEKAEDFVNYLSSRADWSGAIPFVVVIDKSGIVQYMQAGMVEEDEMASIIKELSK